ncbi:MAG: hypothetical protein AAGB02_08840 [Pseudomonadota bacterium]
MTEEQDEEIENASAMGQAYQVIGVLAHKAGLFDHPDVQRALDYFSRNQYREDFLPFSIRDLSPDK